LAQIKEQEAAEAQAKEEGGRRQRGSSIGKLYELGEKSLLEAAKSTVPG